MDERFDLIEEKLEELAAKLEEISCKVDSVSSDIETDVENAVESAISDLSCDLEGTVEDALSNVNVGQAPLITVFSQDKKFIIPAYAFEARRKKNGEEPYLIIAQASPSGNTRVVGRYDNKDAALSEMQKIFKAVYGGPKFYEIK
ncbi:MAG: hypothetical protein J6D45_02850 [Clostridia bacterium]|nr:hypothetical protein [Clostridia bacterium]